jgi:hypothetical protein
MDQGLSLSSLPKPNKKISSKNSLNNLNSSSSNQFSSPFSSPFSNQSNSQSNSQSNTQSNNHSNSQPNSGKCTKLLKIHICSQCMASPCMDSQPNPCMVRPCTDNLWAGKCMACPTHTHNPVTPNPNTLNLDIANPTASP